MYVARLTPKQLWQAAQGELELKLTRPVYETWIRHVTAVGLEEGALLVRAPSTFAKEWIEERIGQEIRTTISRISGAPLELVIVVGQGDAAANPMDTVTDERPAWSEPLLNEGSAPALSEPPRSKGWYPNPNYTFNRFIVGRGNQLAHAAAQAVAFQPGQAYNPLFIYGGVGLGKTHLLHAIAHGLIGAGRRSVYISSEQFTNDLIRSIRENRTQDFRERYRGVDALMVDDIQFIAGKEATQEEFFHTFNTLHSQGRQIVISSDRSPKAIATLEERLRSRFSWGLIADIQPPDLETRQAILTAKAQGLKLGVAPPVIQFLAQHIQSNIRDLEGALNRIAATAALSGRPISLEMAEESIADIVSTPAQRFLRPEEIIDAVARYYKVEPVVLKGKSRGEKIVLPRQLAMYLLREEIGVSLVAVGKLLGDRDHTTVMHGCKRIAADLMASDQLRRELAAIRDYLYSGSGRR